MAQLLQHGGWLFLAILALSVAAWGLLVWKWLTIRAEVAGGHGWADRVIAALAAGDEAEAKRLCGGRRNRLAALLAVALETRVGRRVDFEKHLRPMLDSEAHALRGHLPLIAAMASAAPLLGLLGTVLGMITTFDALTAHGTAEVDRVAGGVSQALITTQASLVVALPVVVLHSYLRGRVERHIETAALYVKKVETLRCGD